MVVDKGQKTTVVIDVAILSDAIIRTKEHEMLEKFQGLKEKLERMWKVKSTVVPVVTGALGAVTPKLGERLQQIPGATSEVPEERSLPKKGWEGDCAPIKRHQCFSMSI